MRASFEKKGICYILKARKDSNIAFSFTVSVNRPRKGMPLPVI